MNSQVMTMWMCCRNQDGGSHMISLAFASNPQHCIVPQLHPVVILIIKFRLAGFNEKGITQQSNGSIDHALHDRIGACVLKRIRLKNQITANEIT